MADQDISQQEADFLIQVNKRYEGKPLVNYPPAGACLNLPCWSIDDRNKFNIDVTRGRIELRKVSHQLRVHTSIPLLRLEIDASPHRNPDHRRVSGTHVHVYREGFGLAWAYELGEVPEIMAQFDDLGDPGKVCQDFLHYCSITNPPGIAGDLF